MFVIAVCWWCMLCRPGLVHCFDYQHMCLEKLSLLVCVVKVFVLVAMQVLVSVGYIHLSLRSRRHGIACTCACAYMYMHAWLEHGRTYIYTCIHG